MEAKLYFKHNFCHLKRCLGPGSLSYFQHLGLFSDSPHLFPTLHCYIFLFILLARWTSLLSLSIPNPAPFPSPSSFPPGNLPSSTFHDYFAFLKPYKMWLMAIFWEPEYGPGQN